MDNEGKWWMKFYKCHELKAKFIYLETLNSSSIVKFNIVPSDPKHSFVVNGDNEQVFTQR